MKTFGYTSRDKSGSLKKGTLQAVDRIDALRQIKALGYVPVSVIEGKGLDAARTSWNLTLNRRSVAGLAVATVVLVATLAVWLNVDRKPVAQRQALSAAVLQKTPAKVRTAPTPRLAENVKPSTHPAPDMAEPVRPVEKPSKPAKRPPANQATLPAPEPVAAEPKQPQRPEAYKSQTEQLLAMAMSVTPGGSVPPLPISSNLNADFAKSVTNTILVFDDNDERAVNIKANVAAAKSQMLELVKQGKNVSEVLKEYQDKTNEQAEMRSVAQRELSDIYINGSKEEAAEYMEKINKAFSEMGIDPIALPRARAAQ